MYPPRFDYYRATSVQEALSLLRDHPEAKVLAGGHSLLPMMKLRLAAPPVLIDIGRIDELRGIQDQGNTVRIGALTTHWELEKSDLLARKCPLIPEAAAQIGDRQVRHRGTIGGNLVHADPGSDLPAVILALEGTLHIAGQNGSRQVAAKDFFLDLMTTAIQPDEILTAVEVPVLGERTGTAYLKFEHPASGYAVCGAAAIMTLNADGTVARARLCFNGITATPFDAQAVADALVGKQPDDATIDAAVDGNLTVNDPIGDIFASGAYRVELAKAFAKRALKRARDRAAG